MNVSNQPSSLIGIAIKRARMVELLQVDVEETGRVNIMRFIIKWLSLKLAELNEGETRHIK